MKYHLYIMETDLYIKIGVTEKNPKSRAKALQTGCPVPIHTIHFTSFDSKLQAFHTNPKEKTFSFMWYHVSWIKKDE